LTSSEQTPVRLMGVEDGSFQADDRSTPQISLLCCVEMCSGRLEAVRLTRVEVDGFDATVRLLELLEGVEVDGIILGGITFAGFNMVDPVVVNRATGFPVIVYSGKNPDNEEMLSALRRHFPDWERRWRIVEGLGKIYSVKPRKDEPPIYFEVVGAPSDWAEEVLRNEAIISRIPEPVRVAGLVARGLSLTY
jgi:endonuclease V-like protein UPF0215 family